MILDKLRSGHTVVVSKTRTGFSAHLPEVPVCIATGRTREETLLQMLSAFLHHRRGLREDGLWVPRPRSLDTLRRKELITGIPMYRAEHKAPEVILRETASAPKLLGSWVHCRSGFE